MKRITLLLALLMTLPLMAQVPQKMSYQAIIRDASDLIVPNQNIGMQISILQGATDGTAVYVETQTPTSNSNGLINLDIGAGTIVTGDFSTIDWGNGPYFIKTEADITGGTTYTITGTSQLQSVPYALYARSSGTANNANLNKCNCSSYIISYLPYGNTIQAIITISNILPTWNGNGAGTGVATDVYAEVTDLDGNYYDLGFITNVASGATARNITTIVNQKLQILGFSSLGMSLRFTMSNPENVYMYANYRNSSDSGYSLEINCIR